MTCAWSVPLFPISSLIRQQALCKKHPFFRISSTSPISRIMSSPVVANAAASTTGNVQSVETVGHATSSGGPAGGAKTAMKTNRAVQEGKRRSLKVAVVGCTHGELDTMYAAVREIEQVIKARVDLILCPGDFQAARNVDDLETMACPRKYHDMRTFWRYYAGLQQAPTPTIFVGGNHEATNHLQELPLGGLVAPNMYFLGNAGVVRFRGLRIAGVSGVFVENSYRLPRREVPPYGQDPHVDKRQYLYHLKTAYRVRKTDVDRLKRLRVRGSSIDENGSDNVGDNAGSEVIDKVNVCISHDWPKGIWKYGDEQNLRRCKPFLVEDIDSGRMGNPPAMELIHALRPDFWFAAHMHFKFPALVRHGDTAEHTKFLALDKIVQGRDFLQVVDVPITNGDGEDATEDKDGDEATLQLDAEWLTILRTDGRSDCVTGEEIAETMRIMKEQGIETTVRLKSDFEQRAALHDGSGRVGKMPTRLNFESRNLQLLSALGLPDPPGWCAMKAVQSQSGRLRKSGWSSEKLVSVPKTSIRCPCKNSQRRTGSKGFSVHKLQ